MKKSYDCQQWVMQPKVFTRLCPSQEEDNTCIEQDEQIIYDIIGNYQLIQAQMATSNIYQIECQQVFPPSINNYDFYSFLANQSNIINDLLQSKNVAFITYGRTGTGKSHSLFGTDSLFNDTRIHFNLLSFIFDSLQLQLANCSQNNLFGLSACEITFQDQVESLYDLLILDS